jgi:hypothetical protein
MTPSTKGTLLFLAIILLISFFSVSLGDFLCLGNNVHEHQIVWKTYKVPINETFVLENIKQENTGYLTLSYYNHNTSSTISKIYSVKGIHEPEYRTFLYKNKNPIITEDETGNVREKGFRLLQNEGVIEEYYASDIKRYEMQHRYTYVIDFVESDRSYVIENYCMYDEIYSNDQILSTRPVMYHITVYLANDQYQKINWDSVQGHIRFV